MILKIRRFIRMNTSLVVYSILLLVGVIALFVGLVPALQKSITLIRDLQTLQDEMNRIGKKVTMLSALNQEEMERRSEDVLSAVPTDKSVSTLLSSVEAVAYKNGLSISDMSIEAIGSLATGSGKQQTKPEGNTLTETVSLQGTLIQLREFLSGVVRVRRLMTIKNMALTAMPKSTLMTAQLSIEVYSQPLPTTIGKASDPIEPFSQKEIDTLDKVASYPVVFTTETQPLSPQEPSPVGREPTTPTVADPFTNSEIKITPSPTPLPTLTTTPSPTSTETPEPTTEP